MSFASEIKRELIDLQISSNGAKAELAALLKLNGRINIVNSNLIILFHTKTPAIARRVVKLITFCYKIELQIVKQKIGNLNKSSLYIVKIKTKSREILSDLKILTEKGIVNDVNQELLSTSISKRAYLRGCFLASGSVNSPDKPSYHLEILLHHQTHAKGIQELLEEFNITAKILQRKKGFLLYIKEAEKIADFLRIIEAPRAVLDFEDVRIMRDMNNSVNRIRNCDIANVNKSWNASQKQIKAINLILETQKESDIEKKLIEVMQLRLEYPEATLNELSKFSKGNISKSGINHRLRKIQVMADKIQSDKNKLIKEKK